jgi:hypothetical protein
VPTGHAPTQQPSSTGSPAPPAAKWSPLFAAPANAAAAEPVAVPIPLPRKRPDPAAVAEATMPLPQPRPNAAGPGEPLALAGQSDSPGGIFHSSPSSTAAPEPVHQGDY